MNRIGLTGKLCADTDAGNAPAMTATSIAIAIERSTILRFPDRSTVATAFGGTIAVAEGSSMIAGPFTRAPAASA